MSRLCARGAGAVERGGDWRLALAVAIIAGAAGGASAQESGDARAGLELARRACASCHAVERGNTRSPHDDAPAFATIAAVPGMSPAALTAALHTSHATMPNLVLAPDDRANVVAYILSLGPK